jgi:hypothetical protein
MVRFVGELLDAAIEERAHSVLLKNRLAYGEARRRDVAWLAAMILISVFTGLPGV